MKKELWITTMKSGHHYFDLRYSAGKSITFTGGALIGIRPFSIGVINHGRVNSAGALLALDALESLTKVYENYQMVPAKLRRTLDKLKTYMAEYLEETE